MTLSEVFVSLIKDFVIECVPIAFFVFAVRMILRILFSALNGKIDI